MCVCVCWCGCGCVCVGVGVGVWVCIIHMWDCLSVQFAKCLAFVKLILQAFHCIILRMYYIHRIYTIPLTGYKYTYCEAPI